MLSEHTKEIVEWALAEDIGTGDVTTRLTIPRDTRSRVTLLAKQDGVLSGIEVFQYVFDCVEADAVGWQAPVNGTIFEAGEVIATFEGNTASVLMGERTAMNFLQHLSGVATLTKMFVDAVDAYETRICDTRKTTPLLRDLEKQAVVHGGGSNHRHNLSDGILLKDNHIAAAGSVTAAVRKARQGAHHLMRVEVEVTSLEELQEAIDAGADVILLDNMRVDQLRAAVQDVGSQPILLEASGNVTLDNVQAIAETGVHYISVGMLTHSAPVVDFSLQLADAS